MRAISDDGGSGGGLCGSSLITTFFTSVLHTCGCLGDQLSSEEMGSVLTTADVARETVGVLQTGRHGCGVFLGRRGDVVSDDGGLGVNGGVKQLYCPLGLDVVLFLELLLVLNIVLSMLMSYVYKI